MDQPRPSRNLVDSLIGHHCQEPGSVFSGSFCVVLVAVMAPEAIYLIPRLNKPGSLCFSFQEHIFQSLYYRAGSLLNSIQFVHVFSCTGGKLDTVFFIEFTKYGYRWIIISLDLSPAV